MATAEQENSDLREEVGNLKEGMEKITAMMIDMMAAQAQASQAQNAQTTQAHVEASQSAGSPAIQPIPTTSADTSQPIPTGSTAAVGTTQPLVTDMYNSGFHPVGPSGFSFPPQYCMPPGYPWGMPLATNEGFRHNAPEMQFPLGQQQTPFYQTGQPFPQATMTYAGPLVHAAQQEEEQVYHSNSVAGDDRVGNLEEKYDAVHKELKSIRGKEVFSHNLNDLCLVADVVIPPKFKVPTFEKYTGNTCPEIHLIMYVRRMTAHRKNEPLLIYCFQDSLAGPALTWYMNLKGITTFEELANAFIQQYKYNSYLAPNRKELQAMTQGDKESFKEYAQRFIQKSAQIRPPLEEREVADLFYETLSPFYSEKMLLCASQKFTDMVDAGVRIEEWVRKGRGSKDGASSGGYSGSLTGGSSNGNRRFGNGYPKKNAPEVGMVAHGGSQPVYPNYPYIANIPLPIPAPQNPNYQPRRPQAPPPYYPPLYQSQPYQPRPFYQQPYPPPQQQQQPRQPRPPRNQFPPIPMMYRDLLPSLLARGLVQIKPRPPVPNPLPHWYRPDLTCEFHQGAPGHDIEHCYPLKDAVQRLIHSKDLSFTDPDPVAPNNPLPPHGPTVNMIENYQEDDLVTNAQDVRTPLVPMHVKMCNVGMFSHDHINCEVCSADPHGCIQVQNDVQGLMDQGELVVTREDKNICVVIPVFKDRTKPIGVVTPIFKDNAKTIVDPLAICVPKPKLFFSQKAIPYSYESTGIKDGKGVLLGPSTSVDNIAESSQILRSGRILPAVVQAKNKAPVIQSVPIPDPSKGKSVGQPSGTDNDEILKLIKKSDYKIVDQLLQTPSKISIMSLLTSSDAHREALMKVLNQAYVDHDVTLDQFGSIVGNVTACNNLSFSEEDLPVEGKNHNMALHISVTCKTDSLSNVLIDTGSSLNVMAKTTFDKLTYSDGFIRPSCVSVRAFDGSRKTVWGEIDLPITIGPQEFKVTFQIMDIQASYSCLLGRPWIHEAGAVTSTLHQKLKFVSHGKLVTVSGESALLVSHLSSFSFIGGESLDGTSFQGFSVESGTTKGETCMASLRDAQRVIQEGKAEGWGQLVQLPENKRKEGLGFSGNKQVVFDPTRGTFHSAGFINTPPETNAILEDQSEEVAPDFVTPDGNCCNWIAVDIPSAIPFSKLSISEPVERSDPMLPPNWEFPVYEAWVEEDEEIPNELRWMLEQERKAIQPHKEEIESINLGTEEDKKEIKIGTSLEASVKNRIIELLREYDDIFAWSYKDMPGLDPNVVEHRLPLKPECPPVKQKLRRSHPDMALKIKEEVRKQIDAGFLITSEYPQWLANIVPVPKKDGKVRMCVDYRDLNKASPKDDFPLPHIDVLVDSTARCKVFSFMDEFSGYNQIKMAPEDREKTSFITPWGAFCYLVMPFGLINAGATYQRGMTKIFHDMIHKEIEVYVDDMIVKSGTEEEHADQKGIEVDPDKVKAIREMPAPKTEKQVRGFLGRLNYISRFISHMTATCGPIFKLLRKDQGIVWTEDCQKAFDSIKGYLLEPPILVPPVEGRPLIMYLTVLDDSMGCVLGQQDETGKKEHAIYYLSKKFTDCESRYSMLEKTCCALAWAAKRLRHYMVYHTTWLISKMDPIKYLFEKPALTGRIARWQMLLSEYDIVYRTQKAIKGSVLADHLAHQPIEDYQPIKFDFPDEEIMYLKMKDCDEPLFGEGPDPDSKWGLIFDGAVNVFGNGIGAVILTPKGTHIPFTARLRFDCTNNIAEYEIKGKWETHHAGMIPYRDYARRLLTFFNKVELHHIPRDENRMADALATLSSMIKVNRGNDVPLISVKFLDRPAYVFVAEAVFDD
ncbi:uncharacterized protein [Medicago truncatula]|uniref:uncharacterized protein n=1 Tax=Medicago truncatula TaxID=3880 RepID=UPI00196860CD|nr:uncharacterized protein LOC112420859 [Medicago truncatula]